LNITQLFLVLLLLPGISLTLASDNQNKRQQATQKELNKLQLQIKKLLQNQTTNRTTLSQEQQALKQTDVLVGQSRTSLEKTRSKLLHSQSRLSVLKVQRQRLLKEKNDQQNALIKQIRGAYAGGKQEFIKLLLNQEDATKVGRTLVYYDYLNKARVEKIQVLNITLEKLVQVEIEITAEQQQLKTLEVDLAQENNRLAILKKERQGVISQLNLSLKNSTKQLKEWQENEQDLLSLLEALKQSAATLIPEESLDGLSSLKGTLNWPVNGQIKETFGSVRGNTQMRWSGVLITANEGQAVNAIYHGRVVYSDYLRGFGLIIILDHGNGYMSLYGHNEGLLKQLGDWVEAGEQIATVGQSGGYPTTGLYFEIRLRSKALNPVSFIHN
jgi:septal ring factor EnvC (AmiA/AmiB activator)